MQDRQCKVEDHRSYTKNPMRGTVVNTNASAYASRKAKLKKDAEVEERMDKLESELSDIKDMLKVLINSG